jgi:plasmid stabilization system protein ParE
MDWEVVWTEPAVTDLEEIVRFVGERNASAAESLRVELLNHVEVLGRFPLIGPLYEKDSTGRTREIVCRKYRIFYRVVDQARRVEILTVWHSARQEPDLPG